MQSLSRLKTSALLIVFIGFLLYVKTIGNGFILGDDTDQILENTQIRSLGNIPTFFTGSTYFRPESGLSFGLYYRPVMMVTFTVLHALMGTDPLIYHLLQITLHIATALVLLLLLRALFPKHRLLALFLSLIYVVHPGVSEAVLFVSAIQDVMYMLFGLSAIFLLTKKETLGQRPGTILITFLLLLTLFAKETGVVFLLLAVSFVFIWQKKQLKKIIIVSGVTLLIYAIFRFGIAAIGFGEASIARIGQANFTTRLLNIPMILTHFVRLFIFPKTLEVHQSWLITSFSFSEVILPLLLVFSISLCLFFVGRKIHMIRRREFPLFVFFLIWTLLGILPHVHLIPLDVTFVERWFVLPLVGILGLLGCGIVYYQKYFRAQKLWLVICIVILGLLSVRTFMRIADWHDSETLFRHDLQTAKESYYVENLYGSLLIQEGRIDEAEAYVTASLTTYPFLSNLSNMAIIHMKKGDWVGAESYFEQSLQKRAIYPQIVNYVNFLVFVKKDYEKASDVINKYLPLYPKSGALWMAYALSQHYLGLTTEALGSAQMARTLMDTSLTREIEDALVTGREPEVERFLAY
ncbi:hypothetical protein C4579_02495 [Candidatus Microgenomates bacterium]|nr:MAG: hypothetical protein C4579_02495 [Candidatus Microgenomates bacterium]